MAVAFRGADVPVDDVCATLDGETRWKHEHLGESFFSARQEGCGNLWIETVFLDLDVERFLQLVKTYM